MAPKITLDELRERIGANPDLVLVEALPEQYFRHSHLPGAINLPQGPVDRGRPAGGGLGPRGRLARSSPQ